MVWIELWPLLFAVLNSAISIFAKNAGIEDITLASVSSIVSVQGTYAMMAYGMSLSVPPFAYMLAKGGVGSFVHMAGSLVAPTQSAAGAVAGEVASGNRSFDNVSLNNISYQNVSGYKHSTAMIDDSGHITHTDTSGNRITDYVGSDQWSVDTAAKATRGLSSIKYDEALQLGLTNSIAEHKSKAASESKRSSEILSQAESHAAEFMERHGESKSVGEGISLSDSIAKGSDTVKSSGIDQKVDQSYSYGKEQSRSIEGGIGGGLGAKGGIGAKSINASASLGVRGGGNLRASDSSSQGLSEVASASESISHQSVEKSFEDHVKSLKYDQLSQEDKGLVDSIRKDFQESKTLASEAHYQESQARDESKLLNRIRSSSLHSSTDITDKLIAYAYDHKGKYELNNKSMAAKELGIYGDGVSDTGRKIISDYLNQYHSQDQRALKEGRFKEAKELLGEGNYEDLFKDRGHIKKVGKEDISDAHVKDFKDKTSKGFALLEGEAIRAKAYQEHDTLSKAAGDKVTKNIKTIGEGRQSMQKEIDKAEDGRYGKRFFGQDNPNTQKRKEEN